MPQNSTSWTLPGTIDRRPMIMIDAFGGDNVGSCSTDEDYPDEIEQRTRCWWRGENGVILLNQRIEDAFDTGYRRIFINRPLGNLANQIVPSTFWGAMPSYKQSLFESEIKPYLKTKDRTEIELGAYIGYKPNEDSSSVSMFPDSNIRIPDLTKRADIEWYIDTLQPLIDIGFKFFILDDAASDDNRESFYDLASAFWSRGVKLLGESIPKITTVENGVTFRMPDPVAMNKGHWVFLEQQLDNGNIANSWPEWEIDADATESHLFLQGGIFSGVDTSVDSSASRQFIQDWVDRGFVVSSWENGHWFGPYLAEKYGEMGSNQSEIDDEPIVLPPEPPRSSTFGSDNSGSSSSF